MKYTELQQNNYMNNREKMESIELDEEQEKNPYETLLISDIGEELKPGHMKREKW